MQKTLAIVNLANIKHNARFVRTLIGDRFFFAVVKADGYGHGGAEVARALEEIIDGFCVAITDEGVALRVSGITKPILVLTPPLGDDDVARAKFYNLTLTVNSVRTAKLVGDARCHIKINTGMNRHGCNLNQLPEVLKLLDPKQIAGVYSHMYNPANAAASEKQLFLFNRAERMVKLVNGGALSHFAASGGVLSGEKFLKEGVRCGILLYGYPPEGFSANVKPALKVYARRTQQTPFIGGGVGYAPARRQYSVLSTYRLGYADGFLRGVPLGESPLCMDSFIKSGGEELELVLSDAQSYAKKCKTIPYEVLCAATRRAERIYE